MREYGQAFSVDVYLDATEEELELIYEMAEETVDQHYQNALQAGHVPDIPYEFRIGPTFTMGDIYDKDGLLLASDTHKDANPFRSWEYNQEILGYTFVPKFNRHQYCWYIVDEGASPGEYITELQESVHLPCIPIGDKNA
jgi:hypothetical protein